MAEYCVFDRQPPLHQAPRVNWVKRLCSNLYQRVTLTFQNTLLVKFTTLIVSVIILVINTGLLVPRWTKQDEDRIKITAAVISIAFIMPYAIGIALMCIIICLSQPYSRENIYLLTFKKLPGHDRLDNKVTRLFIHIFGCVTVIYNSLYVVKVSECQEWYGMHSCSFEGRVYLVHSTVITAYIGLQAVFVACYYKMKFEGKLSWLIRAVITIMIPANIAAYFYALTLEANGEGNRYPLPASCNVTTAHNDSCTSAMDDVLEEIDFFHFPIEMELLFTMAALILGFVPDANMEGDGDAIGIPPLEHIAPYAKSLCTRLIEMIVIGTFILAVVLIILIHYVEQSNSDRHDTYVIAYNWLWAFIDLLTIVYTLWGSHLVMKYIKPENVNSTGGLLSHSGVFLELVGIFNIVTLILLDILAAISHIRNRSTEVIHNQIAISVLVEALTHLICFVFLLWFLVRLNQWTRCFRDMRDSPDQYQQAIGDLRNILLPLSIIILTYCMCYVFNLHDNSIQPIQQEYYNNNDSTWRIISFIVYPFCIYFWIHVFKHFLTVYLRLFPR